MRPLLDARSFHPGSLTSPLRCRTAFDWLAPRCWRWAVRRLRRVALGAVPDCLRLVLRLVFLVVRVGMGRSVYQISWCCECD